MCLIGTYFFKPEEEYIFFLLRIALFILKNLYLIDSASF